MCHGSGVMEEDAVPLRAQPPEEGFMDVPEMLALPPETVMPCDIHFILEVTVQLNVKSQAWKKSSSSSQAVWSVVLTMRNGPAKHNKAIQLGKRACQDIWKLTA
ncbi:hypothetical protein DUI87_27703 [Hirundo rustica rustica]|uniref:Uncharacterized protein n=1 Tax=Hirundo rustica rustica TaxID=333673 RepID=A0A3M0J9N0_HIRRU|nr:hypothetical protein DUI87_27703 [Hirundo rustica rustica]